MNELNAPAAQDTIAVSPKTMNPPYCMEWEIDFFFFFLQQKVHKTMAGNESPVN